MKVKLLFTMVTMSLLVTNVATAATVFRILNENERVVLSLSDDEVITLEEGKKFQFVNSAGQRVAGKVVKVTGSRALVDVESGFNNIRRNSSYILASADSGDTTSDATYTTSNNRYELSTDSQSPFANEYQPSLANYYLNPHGRDAATYIARVPKYQVGVQYLHLLSADSTSKSDTVNDKLKLKSGSIMGVNGVVHLAPQVWLGAFVDLTGLKVEYTDKKSSRPNYKSTLSLENQSIALKGAWLLNQNWVLGLTLENVKNEGKVKAGAASDSDTITYNQVKPSVAYYGQDLELVVSYRPKTHLEEGINSVAQPATVALEGEFRVSDLTSIRGALAYFWFNRVSQEEKNTLIPSVGVVQRLGLGRLQGDFTFTPDHYRKGGENDSSVQGFGLALAYYHMFTAEVEGVGSIQFKSADGGDDTKVKSSMLSALLGVNYKG